MSPAVQAIFDDWSPPLFLTAMVLFTAIVYTRGWFVLRKTRPAQFSAGRLAAFLAGLAILWLAVGSPMDGFADALLSAHMVEHLLLMSFVPPLVLLGDPQVPLLRGLPRVFTVHMLGPLFRFKALRVLGRFLTRPLVAWFAMNVIFLGWHVPSAYDFALEHEGWHDFEHICFLFSSILFWWPIIRPWPTSARYPGWLMLPYLVGADVVNTALSAFLAFCNRPVYAYYIDEPNPFNISPMADQVTGAVIMWVVGSLVFLIPAVVITFRLVQQDSKLQR
ncbi:MAG TPA: cytochrome c oxidase assembly protein [Terracidiphilus sp.]|nr:cytochrome c oxidase assembly protein [Terracidiphilus sp.]